MNIAPDKKLHALVGAAIGLFFAVGWLLVLGPQLPGADRLELGASASAVGSVAAYAAGWAKEYVYDARRQDRHTVDPADMHWTGLGGVLGALLVLVYVLLT